jgi:hypothetical protein
MRQPPAVVPTRALHILGAVARAANDLLIIPPNESSGGHVSQANRQLLEPGPASFVLSSYPPSMLELLRLPQLASRAEGVAAILAVVSSVRQPPCTDAYHP